MNKIIVLIPCDEAHRRLMQEAVPDAQFVYTTPADLTREEIADARIVFGTPDPVLLQYAGKLEFLQLSSAGVDGYIAPGVLPEGVELTNTTGAFGQAISEHMLGMLLEIYKKLHLYRDQQPRHLWTDCGKVRTIVGATVVILGLGNIGGEFAKKVKALGAYTIGVKRTAGEKPDYIDELYTTDSLDELLERADVLAMALPGTKETAKIMDRRRIGLMKKDSVILNVGRGSAIDLDALRERLEDGSMLGAGLDVTDPEPLPEDHPLWDVPSAVITPHISGWFFLQETYENIFNIGKNNMVRFLKGEKLQNYVDFQAGYAKKNH